LSYSKASQQDGDFHLSYDLSAMELGAQFNCGNNVTDRNGETLNIRVMPRNQYQVQESERINT